MRIAGAEDAGERISSLFARCGKVVSATVRIKEGTSKSWALVTFNSVMAASAALEVECTVLGDADAQTVLPVHLKQQKQTAGALQMIERKHAIETEARTRFNAGMLEIYQFRETARNSAELVGFLMYKISYILEAAHTWLFYVR